MDASPERPPYELEGVGAVTLLTEDLAACSAFYADVLGLRQVHADDDSTAFRLGSLVVNVLRVEAGPEVLDPAPVGARDAGVRALYTIGVDDADAACARFTARGAVLDNGPIDRPWGVRTAVLRDPAGHAWEISGPVAGAEVGDP